MRKSASKYWFNKFNLEKKKKKSWTLLQKGLFFYVAELHLKGFSAAE